jgi:hypothetical protein
MSSRSVSAIACVIRHCLVILCTVTERPCDFLLPTYREKNNHLIHPISGVYCKAHLARFVHVSSITKCLSDPSIGFRQGSNEPTRWRSIACARYLFILIQLRVAFSRNNLK